MRKEGQVEDTEKILHNSLQRILGKRRRDGVRDAGRGWLLAGR